MNMMDSRKFRRKRKPLTPGEPSVQEDTSKDMAPVPPLETREERLARRALEEGAQHPADPEASRLARAREAARLAAAEARRRAEEQAEADARREAEDQASADAEAEAQRQAEEHARTDAEAEARRQAEELARAEAEAEARRQAEELERAEAEAEERRRKLAEARQAAKLRRAEEARLAEEARREAATDEDDTDTDEAQADTPPARPVPAMPPLSLTPEQRSHPAPAPGPAPAPAPAPRPEARRPQPDTAWLDLPVARFELGQLNHNRVVTADRLDPAHATFDVLRTRLMHTLAERGWKRVAVTSPGKGCGKTFTVANLAISLSRQENTRTLVMDFDMRRPNLHRVLGVDSPGPIGDMLRGRIAPEDHLIRLGENDFNAGHNIAFGLNTVTEPYASELLQDPRTRSTLERIEVELRPDVMLFDLPPALSFDDVIAFQPLFDGVLLVVGGGLTTEREIKEVERRLGTETPLLGMILNKAEGVDVGRYAY
ncbi:CpsD/CapB family tyrosine-protein kinase [Sagittula sp.]|uniref:CpsD/CapB family tyrosine-protein kinase n=1 Tax=Sagittula sp. TaxID=2038081 RepID=UPI003514B1A9